MIETGFSDYALKAALYPLLRSGIEITIERKSFFQVTLVGDTKMGVLTWSYDPDPIPTDPVILAKDIAKRAKSVFPKA